MDSNILTAFNQGKHEEAIQAAVKAIDADPKNPKRYAVLTTMLISLKALDQAGELLAKARALFQMTWNYSTQLVFLPMRRRIFRQRLPGLLSVARMRR